MKLVIGSALFVCGSTACLVTQASAQVTYLASRGPNGAAVQGNSRWPAISADGRYVAFASPAAGLVPGDTNNEYDVFVRDRQTGALQRASVSSAGVQSNGYSGYPMAVSLSADGHRVAFMSYGSTLVPGDTNGVPDVFVRDLSTGTTERVSVSSTGVQANAASGTSGLAISQDGRFVVFSSSATNLVPGDTNVIPDVFVRDLQSGTTERVSVDSSGVEASLGALVGAPAISANGRFVAFVSCAANLVAGDTNATSDVFLRDRQSGTTERVSVSSSGAESNDGCSACAISADGRWVVFTSGASNLVPADTNNYEDVFVRDRTLGTTERVSVSTTGTEGNDWSGREALSISADGNVVTYSSLASDLVPGDTNGVADVFARDRPGGSTERVSIATNAAQANGECRLPAITNDGRYIVFMSSASNLVTGDVNTLDDVFVRDRLISITSYCSGDGSATACPCGNLGSPGNGCASSVDPRGARLSASGQPSLGDDSVHLDATHLPNGATLFVQGTAQFGGGLGLVFGDGLRCVGGTIVRLGTHTPSNGSSTYPLGAEASVSVRGAITTPGTRTYQAWYRNASAFCTTSTFNLTNGLQIVWGF